MITKRRKEKINNLLRIQWKRESDNQDIGFNSRPFVLCGLPYKKQKSLTWERRNGDFFLRVEGSENQGLPFGQDRMIPIFLATKAIQQKKREVTWNTAGEILDLFGLARNGRNYQRLIERFKRIFSSTIYWGAEGKQGLVWKSFRFMDEMQLWYTWKNFDNLSLPLSEMQNKVVLTELFWKELQKHPIPIDMEAVKAFIDSPGLLDFYCWLVWRSWTAKRTTLIPLTSSNGLFAQLGMKSDRKDRLKKRTLKAWLNQVQVAWPEYQVRFSDDEKYLIVPHGKAIRS